MSKTIIIGVSGGIASGKSKICEKLMSFQIEKGKDCNLIEMDSYYKDLKYI